LLNRKYFPVLTKYKFKRFPDPSIKFNMDNKASIFFMIVSALLLVLLPFVGSVAGNNLQADKPQTVPHVDVASYLGKWYEQAVIPYYFERDCTHTTATYSLNKDNTIRVDNSCTRNGKQVESVGKAVPEDSTNAKLKVEFVQTLDIGAQYWVVMLASDYSYSVVSSPDYKYLWILSRTPQMEETVYNSIIEELKKRGGFQVNKLKRTVQ
jgi:apolipoprotein D and lipocalin family protein